jgi:hypothetical protein
MILIHSDRKSDLFLTRGGDSQDAWCGWKARLVLAISARGSSHSPHWLHCMLALRLRLVIVCGIKLTLGQLNFVELFLPPLFADTYDGSHLA